MLHAASDNWIGKLNQTLNAESAKIGDKAPNLSEMLAELKKGTSAPQHIVEQLYEYKDATLKALHSYTHGGMHPLTRIKSGYPYELMYNSLRNGNAVAALTGQLLAITTGDIQNMAPIRNYILNTQTVSRSSRLMVQFPDKLRHPPVMDTRIPCTPALPGFGSCGLCSSSLIYLGFILR